MTLVLYAHTNVRQREVGLRYLCHGYTLYRVALLSRAGCIESILQLHIGVERIILRRRLLLCNRVVQRRANLCLVREELAEVYIGSNRIVGLVVGAAFCHSLLQSAETRRRISSLGIERTKVGQLNIEVALCRPATRVVKLLKS